MTKIPLLSAIFSLLVLFTLAQAQPAPIVAPTTIAGMKAELEKSPNPLLYSKQILKKKFSIDTITVTRTDNFTSLADSLAYKGKLGKVYGPYGGKGHRFLVQILSKAPNLFYHINQIYLVCRLLLEKKENNNS